MSSSAIPAAALKEERLALIAGSYQRLTGKPLLETVFNPQTMWASSRAIVAHGTEDDPVFFYGNQLALELFEMNFDEFSRLPSRLSVEAIASTSRAVLMEKVTRLGFVDNYSGMRIAKNGKRFMITDATVWNLIDSSGVYHGQAATFIA